VTQIIRHFAETLAQVVRAMWCRANGHDPIEINGVTRCRRCGAVVQE
jgi:hypothetical protein